MCFTRSLSQKLGEQAFVLGLNFIEDCVPYGATEKAAGQDQGISDRHAKFRVLRTILSLFARWSEKVHFVQSLTSEWASCRLSKSYRHIPQGES